MKKNCKRTPVRNSATSKSSDLITGPSISIKQTKKLISPHNTTHTARKETPSFLHPSSSFSPPYFSTSFFPSRVPYLNSGFFQRCLNLSDVFRTLLFLVQIVLGKKIVRHKLFFFLSLLLQYSLTFKSLFFSSYLISILAQPLRMLQLVVNVG